MANAIKKRVKKGLFGGNGGEIERRLNALLEAMEAVKKGDVTRKLKKEKEDIIGELVDSYNSMIDMINVFSREVIRVNCEARQRQKEQPDSGKT